MQLKKLIDYLAAQDIKNKIENIDIKGIACDSRKVEKDYIFVAIQGTKEDGNFFIDEAIKKGAKVIITQTQTTSFSSLGSTLFIKVKDTRLALARLAAEFYDHPSGRLKVIGITGTNGKTTISYLIEAILAQAGLASGVIGTVSYKFKDTVIPSSNTTPGPIELQSLLEKMALNHAKYAVIEVSSHALDQERVGAIDFSYAIFTNLTQDHLDYHRDLESYFLAKAKLFKNLKSNSSAIINLDDSYGMRLVKLTPANLISYALKKEADFKATNISLNLAGAEFIITTAYGDCRIKTNLIGQHNIYNVLAAVALAVHEGLDLEVIREGIKNFEFVPGRLEEVKKEGLPFRIFVDYAHTEDAMRNVLSALRTFCSGKIVLVFGCGGDRDRDKRPKMGKLATEMADFIFITSDNPRSENPLKICQEIASGIKNDNYRIVLDRFEAIKEAVTFLEPSDILLIAGKGHEANQIFKDRVIPFDDRKVLREILDGIYG